MSDWPGLHVEEHFILLERLPQYRWWQRRRRTIPRTVPCSKEQALDPPPGYTGHLEVWYTTRHAGKEWGVAAMYAADADRWVLGQGLELACGQFQQAFLGEGL